MILGYTCKYVPIEVFESMGITMERIDPDVTNYDMAEAIMHPNICSYIKGVLEVISTNKYDGVILTNCCDSTKRLYDILKRKYEDKFIYILDLPRKTNKSASDIYELSINDMIKQLEQFSNITFNKDKLKGIIESKEKCQSKDKNKIKVGLMGARTNGALVDVIESSNAEIVFDISCTGDQRIFEVLDTGNYMKEYTYSILNTFPCIRMVDTEKREQYLSDNIKNVDGIIYNTVKFCDLYSYEYSELKDTLTVPMLKLETDCTKQCIGQIKTRVEAFIESLSLIKKSNKDYSYYDNNENINTNIKCPNCDADKYQANIEERLDNMRNDIKKEKVLYGLSKGNGDNNMKDKKAFVLGIDSGSTSTNAVIINRDKQIVASYVTRTGAKSAESAKVALEKVLEKANMSREDITLIVSTGYGRSSISFADKNITEISCHGRGANYLNKDVRTIIDIGGQDSKVINLNEKGEVIDFVMNDKCAAGTGRFLEMMARTLELDINDMGKESLNYHEDINISSMCTVFAESEVISLIAENKEKSDIIHALNKAIAGKTNSLLGRVKKKEVFMMSGGVAQNIGVVNAIEEKIGAKLFIPKEPEIVGAIGAALFGIDEII